MPRWPSLVGHRLGKAVVAGSNPARGFCLNINLETSSAFIWLLAIVNSLICCFLLKTWKRMLWGTASGADGSAQQHVIYGDFRDRVRASDGDR